MIGNLNGYLDFNETALKLRAQRQEVLASNIANADTPHYKAKDIDFATALRQATQGSVKSDFAMATTDSRHLQAKNVGGLQAQLLFRQPHQPSIDGNTVETDVEMAQFSDNALRYQAELTFLNNRISGLRSALQSQ